MKDFLRTYPKILPEIAKKVSNDVRVKIVNKYRLGRDRVLCSTVGALDA